MCRVCGDRFTACVLDFSQQQKNAKNDSTICPEKGDFYRGPFIAEVAHAAEMLKPKY